MMMMMVVVVVGLVMAEVLMGDCGSCGSCCWSGRSW